MIRINLLPSKKKKALILPNVLVYGVFVTLFIIIAAAAFTYHLNSQISSKQSSVLAKETKLKQLQAALEDVKNYEKDNKEFREKTMIIEQLKRNQIVPLRLLDEVSEMLPNGVWLVSLADNAGVVSIEGVAFTNPDLVTYVQNLKGSKYLSEVTLVESRQTEIGEFSVYKFKLTFKVNA